MNILRKIVLILLASVATTSVFAAGSDFNGPFIGVRAAVMGAELDGNVENTNEEVSHGQLGSVFGTAGGELGYSLGLGDSPLFITIGGTYDPGTGTLEFRSKETGSGAENITMELHDHYTVYIAPSIALSETSAFYLKGGYAHMGVNWEGDVQNGPNQIEGYVAAIGTRSMASTGFFVQTEAGFSSYDDIAVQRSSGFGDAQVDPMLAYGSVTVGMKF